MSLEQLHNEVIEYLNDGKFADGIRDFYSEDATARENGAEPTAGRDLMEANERQFLQKVTAFHGIEVHATAVNDSGDGNGIVFYEATMRWDQTDRGAVTVSQTVVERWVDGKIADIRFYGNFDPGPLPS